MRSLFLVLLSLISYPELGAQISTPLLTDGSKTELISFRVPTTAKKKTLKSVEFVLTGATNIDEISLEHHRGSGNRPFATSKKLSEKITLSGGSLGFLSFKRALKRIFASSNLAVSP